MKRKRRLKLGDIYEIPLSDGKFAYGRLFKEYTLAIYKNTYEKFSELPQTEEYSFFVGVYKDLLQDGEWPVVGSRPFPSEEDAWAPPQCIKDAVSGRYSLYYKGEIIPSTENECKDLERAAAWDRRHLVDRLMGDSTWQNTFR